MTVSGRVRYRALGPRAISLNELEREDAMPMYDYECERCGPFTAMQPMARFRDPRACPDCGTEAVRKCIGAPAIARITPGRAIAREAGQPSPTDSRQSVAHPAGCGCGVRRLPLPGALSAGGRVFTSHGPVRRRGQ